MKKVLFFAVFVICGFLCGDAHADIFDSLAGKAKFLGSGLKSSGFIIAGLGMIVFTFMAIFNKLQWKHLAYIMFSTALLSAMVGVISFVSGGKSSASLSFNHQGYSTSGGITTEAGGDVKDVPVQKK